MNERTELKPCPFCGGNPNCGYPKPYRKTKAGYHVLDNAKFCPNCGAKMGGGA